MYFFSRNIRVKAGQTTAKISPAIARITYTTVRPRDTVTISLIMLPSFGIPSGKNNAALLP